MEKPFIKTTLLFLRKKDIQVLQLLQFVNGGDLIIPPGYLRGLRGVDSGRYAPQARSDAGSSPPYSSA